MAYTNPQFPMNTADKILVDQSAELWKLYEELINNGFKNKKLAKLLMLYPSAFSSLFNRVIKPLRTLDKNDKNLSKKVKNLFLLVNNVSETKTRQRLSWYIKILQEFKIEASGTSGEQLGLYINNLVDVSPKEVMKKMEGIYQCYYLSSFGYKIKREPLMVSYNPLNELYSVKKGNELSHACYEGFGYISNNHIFTIQIKELETLIPDNFIAHFHLPPSYSVALNLLKGISISMSNAYLPISRKIILRRISSQLDLKTFNTERTIFFEDDADKENDIVRYLKGAKNLLEYLPIPHPMYDTEDLNKEAIAYNLEE